MEAREAERIGLVNKVFPDAELMEGTYAFARKVADGAPLAVQTDQARGAPRLGQGPRYGAGHRRLQHAHRSHQRGPQGGAGRLQGKARRRSSKGSSPSDPTRLTKHMTTRARSTIPSVRSVAIVGASPQRGNPRNTLVRNLLKHGFKGRVYPVSPAMPRSKA